MPPKRDTNSQDFQNKKTKIRAKPDVLLSKAKAKADAKGKQKNIKRRRLGLKSVSGVAKKKRPRLIARRSIVRYPSTGWIFFSSAQRDALTSKQPNLTFGQQSSILSGEWQSMTTEQKSPFMKQHEQDKLRFQREILCLSPDKVSMLRIHRKKHREIRKAQPKAPLSAYMIFVKDCRPSVVIEHPDMVFDEIGRSLGSMWRDLTDEEKVPYQIQSKTDKDRYIKERSVYNQANKPKKAINNAEKKEDALTQVNK